MTAALPIRELIEIDALVVPRTVEQYHRLIGTDIEEGEPFELLRGQVVRKDRSHRGGDPVTVYPPHVYAVRQLGKLGSRIEPLGGHIRTEQPLTLPPYDEPEPDAVVVTGADTAYRGRHPGPDDVLMVFEVADASLHRDRTTKARIYAAAGIARYAILNLPDRVAELHTEPMAAEGRYGKAETLADDGELAVPTPAGEPVRVRVADLLP